MSKINNDLKTLGGRLRKRREELGLLLEGAAHEIQAPTKYVKALEEDSYEIFPAKVYALGFLRKLMDVLSLEDKENFFKEFSNEWEVQMFRKNKITTPLPENRGEGPYFTPRRLWVFLGGLLLVLFLIFLILRFMNFIGNPKIVLEEPQDQIMLSQPLVRVRGNTEKESRLTVNGREITIDESGKFNQEIELIPGLNVLEFMARNRFGKESGVVRYVLVK